MMQNVRTIAEAMDNISSETRHILATLLGVNVHMLKVLDH